MLFHWEYVIDDVNTLAILFGVNSFAIDQQFKKNKIEWHPVAFLNGQDIV